MMDRYEIAATLLLVLGAVPVLYALGVLLRGWLEYRRDEKLPRTQFTHPTLGPMTGHQGVWSGTATTDGGPIGFFVSGDDRRPDQEELATVERVLESLDTHRRVALECLAQSEDARELATHSRTFKLEAIQSLSGSDFCLEFQLDGDLDGVWRVEFKDGRPVFTGRDD